MTVGGEWRATLVPEDQAVLTNHRFDERAFVYLASELKAGRFNIERNRVAGPIELISEDFCEPWLPIDARQRRERALLGKELLRNKKVGVVILNGGMATRFGGVVKGVVDVVPGHSFLSMKFAAMKPYADVIEVFVMNSFATAEPTRRHMEENRFFGFAPTAVHLLTQNISLRLTPEGDLYRNDAGRVSFYAPGHGDVFDVLRDAEPIKRFIDRGGAILMVSNVDNVGATVAPVLIGGHIERAERVSIEVARRQPGDTGGAPVGYGGRLQVLEGFRFPEDFDWDCLEFFNTNTITFDADVLTTDHRLSWFRADKRVDGDRPVVQFERLMGEISAYEPAAYFEVPRSGSEGRFFPVKTPVDLAQLAPQLVERVAAAQVEAST
jgi:UTP--glucose-1-phosphate uridylyltransferase